MFKVDKPLIFEVGSMAYLIDNMGMGGGILFVGEERALLIDTGCGNTDLKALVAPYIGEKPLLVALTHEHGDHAGGMGQFEKVYAPALEIATMQKYTREFLQKFLDFFISIVTDPDGMCGCYVPKRELVSFGIPEFVPIYDGDVFDLGGRHVTAYRCQVHSKGHMVFVDDKTRILFAGDSISDSTGPASNPINPPTIVSLEDEIRALYHIREHEAEYDRIFGGHPEWGGHYDHITGMEPAVIDRMIRVGEAALRGEIPIGEETGSHGDRSYAAIGQTTLFFFRRYMYDTDLPEEYRYADPGHTPRQAAIKE